MRFCGRVSANVSRINQTAVHQWKNTETAKMNEDMVTLEYKYPWTMIPLESVDEWIAAISESVKESDYLYNKEIFVSGRNEVENLILVDNDTDDSYVLMSFEYTKSSHAPKFNTVEIYNSRGALAEKLKKDHQNAIKKFRK